MSPAAPLDLRLLPTAVGAWGAALIVVHVGGDVGRCMAVIAGVVVVLGLGLLLCTGGTSSGGRCPGPQLLGRVMRGRLIPGHPPSGSQPSGCPPSGCPSSGYPPFGRPLLRQVVLCAAAVGAVSWQAGSVLSGYEASGWTAAVESDRPVQVELRVTSDADRAQRRAPDGSLRLIAEAEVLRAELPDPQDQQSARREMQDLSYDVVLILQVPEDEEQAGTAAEGPEQMLRAGHRYQGMFRTAATEPGQRATALLFPFDEPMSGEFGLEALPADGWTQFTEVFNGMRAATAESASVAIGDGPSLLPGLVLGDRSLQSAELDEAMRTSGLSHLTAVSGANCALVLGALLGTLRMLRAPRWTSVPVCLVGLALFVMLVQPEPSVIRAAVMGSIGAMALFAGRGRASFSLLCVCVTVLLVYDPWFAVQPELQLSVASTAGIVLIGTPIRQLLERRLPVLVAAPLALAFSAQLFVTPVLLPLAEGVNTYAVPANMLAAPLVPLITVPGTFAAVLSTTLPLLSTGILWCSGLAAAGIGAVGRLTAQLPRSLAPWPQGPLGVVLVVLYVLACLILAHHLVRNRPRRGSERSVARRVSCDDVAASGERNVRNGGIGGAVLRVSIVAAAAGAVLGLVVPGARLLGTETGEQWRIALCDVGQADMVVVRTGPREAIVIDTGDDPALAHSCLQDLGVQTVETMMLTHEHQDHIGGAPGVLRGRDVEEVLHAGSAPWQPHQEVDFGDTPSEELEINRAVPGDSRSVGDANFPVRWQIWMADDHHPEPNDNSLVALVELVDPDAASPPGTAEDPLRLLITGDLEQEQTRRALEQERLPRHVDVLSVAHHGAANGGTEMLHALAPDIALIGVGEDNMYGHPAPVITDALDDIGARVYRTDLHGTVVLFFDDEALRAETVTG